MCRVREFYSSLQKQYVETEYDWQSLKYPPVRRILNESVIKPETHNLNQPCSRHAGVSIGEVGSVRNNNCSLKSPLSSRDYLQTPDGKPLSIYTYRVAVPILGSCGMDQAVSIGATHSCLMPCMVTVEVRSSSSRLRPPVCTLFSGGCSGRRK
ncbi:hypothetical protein BJX66DRAFT_315332 [Aspergillus keveii]|uniref:Uncharacterized protein n=1 Tax=Aspergillus keveii TaxID=714993 RepID=A0ABR4FPM9_9EURO